MGRGRMSQSKRGKVARMGRQVVHTTRKSAQEATKGRKEIVRGGEIRRRESRKYARGKVES